MCTPGKKIIGRDKGKVRVYTSFQPYFCRFCIVCETSSMEKSYVMFYERPMVDLGRADNYSPMNWSLVTTTGRPQSRACCYRGTTKPAACVSWLRRLSKLLYCTLLVACTRTAGISLTFRTTSAGALKVQSTKNCWMSDPNQ